MAKVTISTKVDEKLKEKLEAIAKENKQTLSQLIGEKLNQSIEKEESSLDEFSIIKSELAEKNKQISQLQQQLLNQQQLDLYKEQQNLLRLESTAENYQADKNNKEEAKDKKRRFFKWL